MWAKMGGTIDVGLRTIEGRERERCGGRRGGGRCFFIHINKKQPFIHFFSFLFDVLTLFIDSPYCLKPLIQTYTFIRVCPHCWRGRAVKQCECLSFERKKRNTEK